MPAAVVSTEDAIQTLIDCFVNPLLPAKATALHNIDLARQEAIAKQMHAVVLLYNYYHRKQLPELEFLGFKSFCKMACIAKPSLLSCMKFMHAPCQRPEDCKSITEQMVIDACNICTSLDSSKNSPNMDGWPVSKIAVLLVDSVRKNCFLQFGSVTQGVWSLLEKNIDTPVRTKRSQAHASSDESFLTEDMLKLIAYSVVEETAGIGVADITILGQDVTYALSQEKATAQFYIMQYNGTEAINKGFREIPIEFLISRLRGPVLTNCPLAVAPAAEYFHLLPYFEIVSNCLLRETSSDYTLSGRQPQAIGDVYQCVRCKPGKENADANLKDSCSLLTSCGPERIQGDTNDCYSNHSSQPLPFISHIKEEKDISYHESRCSRSDKDSFHVNKELNEKFNGKDKKADILAQNRNSRGDHGLDACSKELSSEALSIFQNKIKGSAVKRSFEQLHFITNNKSMEENESASNVFSMPENGSNNKHRNTDDLDILDVKRLCTESLTTRGCGIDACDMKIPSVSLCVSETKVQSSAMKESNDFFPSVANKKCKDGTGGDAHLIKRIKSSQYSETTNEDIFRTHSNIVEGECSDRECRSSVKGPWTSGKDRRAVEHFALIPLQSGSLNNDGFDETPTKSKKNDQLYADLKALQKRRDELYDIKCQHEDELAKCEMMIQTILSDGNGSVSNVDSVMESCRPLRSIPDLNCSSIIFVEERPQTLVRRRLSEAVLHLRSSCQDLDGICRANNWILPRYIVIPEIADGGFRAVIIVQSLDFELTESGDGGGSPGEARELAASRMLSKLRGMASQRD